MNFQLLTIGAIAYIAVTKLKDTDTLALALILLAARVSDLPMQFLPQHFPSLYTGWVIYPYNAIFNLAFLVVLTLRVPLLHKITGKTDFTFRKQDHLMILILFIATIMDVLFLGEHFLRRLDVINAVCEGCIAPDTVQYWYENARWLYSIHPQTKAAFMFIELFALYSMTFKFMQAPTKK
ncbi:hypothetical protein HG263_05515 [Pseudoalteromonas sp. JBTF-M23]|uniref:Uncharacterized protein n=1 Tax=Pseudoalteromonas caenipelagi TaxID=2726988 RepID=A0A849VDI6_9GAMM|nr:hypothetical protein [Pseudoalteromonas caenipelagi]NOU49994.1 hypothetical protein [Pseudoalteromonas caenipelagi]